MAFLQLHTSQGIKWEDAVKNVHAGQGHVFVCVVLAQAKGQSEESLNYGFFYRHKDGTLCDCLQRTQSVLKTVRTADLAFSFLRDAYPGYWNFSLPYLSEKNLVRPGEVTDQVTLMWDTPPRLADE